MPATYLNTYMVSGRDIRSEIDGARLLSSVTPAEKIYAQIIYNNVSYVVNVNDMLVSEDNLDLSQELEEFLEGLPENKIHAYAGTDIPQRDKNTDKYLHRIAVHDAHGHPAVEIAYTSYQFSDSRNDTHVRARMNELIVTPTNVGGIDLSNCLVSVNGLFHQTVYNSAGLWVTDGFKNIRNIGQHNVALYDTGSVGGHTTIPITLPMLVTNEATDPWQGVVVKMPDGVTLKDKAVFVVINGYLHAYDDTYKILSDTTVKLRMNKVDLISQFMNSPMTAYRKDTFGRPGDNPYDDTTDVGSPTDPGGIIPSPYERLQHFFENIYPDIVADDSTESGSGQIGQYIYDFSGGGGSGGGSGGGGGGSGGGSQTLQEIIRMMPLDQILTPEFAYSAILSKHSFFVIIDNPRLYRTRYRLTPTLQPDQYEHRGKDTPRGLLLYNGEKYLSYVVSSSLDNMQHTFGIGYRKTNTDAYQRAYGYMAIPSPYFDLKAKGESYPAELIEFFAPDDGT